MTEEEEGGGGVDGHWRRNPTHLLEAHDNTRRMKRRAPGELDLHRRPPPTVGFDYISPVGLQPENSSRIQVRFAQHRTNASPALRPVVYATA